MEAPQGTKNMGSWTASVFTEEQQERLGVTEDGRPKPNPAAVPPMHARGIMGGRAGIGPAWTRGEIERPAGEQDMGGWTAAVYTAEQQARLGVDKDGNKVVGKVTTKHCLYRPYMLLWLTHYLWWTPAHPVPLSSLKPEPT